MTSLRGLLIAFDSATYRATVRLDASPGQSLAELPVSRAIPAAELVAGRRVLLDAGEPHNPEEIVVIAVW
jgi:hypothetical protein